MNFKRKLLDKGNKENPGNLYKGYKEIERRQISLKEFIKLRDKK